jgi:hypothetical protein
MMSARIRAELLIIEHVRHPSHRMPIGGLAGAGKSPSDALPRQPLLHLCIERDVVWVVIVEEIIVGGGPEGAEDGQQQAQAH